MPTPSGAATPRRSRGCGGSSTLGPTMGWESVIDRRRTCACRVRRCRSGVRRRPRPSASLMGTHDSIRNPGRAGPPDVEVHGLVAVAPGVRNDGRWAFEDKLSKRSASRAHEVDAHLDHGKPQARWTQVVASGPPREQEGARRVGGSVEVRAPGHEFGDHGRKGGGTGTTPSARRTFTASPSTTTSESVSAAMRVNGWPSSTSSMTATLWWR